MISAMASHAETTPTTHSEPRRRRRAARIAIGVVRWGAAFIACALALLLWWTDRPYLLDLAAQFGPHAFVVAALLSATLLLTRRDGPALAAIIGSAACAGVILRDYRLPTSAPADALRLRVAHFNAHGHSLSPAFLRWVEDEGVDVLCVVESPPELFMTSASPLASLPHALPAGPSWRSNDSVFSRVPMEVVWPTEEAIRRRRTLAVAPRVVRLTLEGGGAALVTTLHPPSPRTEENWRRSWERIERNGGPARDLATDGAPWIIASDMNSTPTGRVHRTFARESGLRGWTPLFGGGTWPASLPRWVALPIDRIWTSPGLAVSEYAVGPRFEGSDHRPIVATVTLPQR